MAVRQTAGKGQRGSTWESEPGKNLTFSVLLYPTFLDIQQQFHLNAAISVAIVRALQEFVEGSLQIKWPNDVLLGERKVAGILIENQVQGRKWKSAIVGLGINVNQESFGEPVSQRATSLKIVTGQAVDLASLLSRLCHYMEETYNMLRQGQTETLLNNYTKYLFAMGEKRTFLIHGGTEISGTILGVNKLGMLLIEINGQQVVFGIKEIEYVF